jgi:hypothetical protein
MNPHRGPLEDHLDAAVPVGSIGPLGDRVEPLDRRWCRVAVRIARARRRHRDPRPDRLEERFGGCGLRAVVGDLEEVDRGKPAREKDRVDVLLDVTREQEPVRPDLAKQHHGDVVDPGSAVGRLARHCVGVRPENPEPDLVEDQAIAGR